jgi:hypothetical protein
MKITSFHISNKLVRNSYLPYSNKLYNKSVLDKILIISKRGYDDSFYT